MFDSNTFGNFAFQLDIRTFQLSCAISYPQAGKRGQEPIVRSTLRAIWLLVPDPFFLNVTIRQTGTCTYHLVPILLAAQRLIKACFCVGR